MAICQATECATVEIITQQIKVFIDLLFEFSRYTRVSVDAYLTAAIAPLIVKLTTTYCQQLPALIQLA